MPIDSITSYLAISKNEQTSVAAFAKSDPATQQGVATLTKKASSLTTPSALLADQTSLGVILAAFNMSADITQTAVLKALLTQPPTASTSLAVTSANNNSKAFAEFMQPVGTVDIGLAPAANLSLTTSGSAASSVTVQNTAFGTASSQTAQTIGHQYSFVLNDGGADASVEGALNAAAGRGSSYTINADGTITVSTGSPPVTVTKDSAGDAVYTLALAADSNGNVTREVHVVSVPVTAGSAESDRTGQVSALTGALAANGFGAAQNADGSISITGSDLDASAGASAGGTTVVPGISAIAAGNTTTKQTVLALGASGTGLQPGQVVHDGNATIGTVKSVDGEGNVTLDAPAASAVSRGDYITVDPLVQTAISQAALSATVSNIAFSAVATTATPSGGNTIALGPAAAGLQAGQTVTAGNTTLGTIQSVDANGTITLSQASSASVAAGEAVTVAAAATATTTPALQNNGRTAAALNEYETNQFENAQDLADPGMHSALYFTRSIGAVTSINQLMSDPTLLNVVTNSIGLPADEFGALDFDQQVRILTKAVDVTKFQDPSYVQRTAEQYLSYEQQNAPIPAATGTLALFGDTSNAAQNLLSIIAGQTLTTSSSSNSTLALFA